METWPERIWRHWETWSRKPSISTSMRSETKKVLTLRRIARSRRRPLRPRNGVESPVCPVKISSRPRSDVLWVGFDTCRSISIKNYLRCPPIIASVSPQPIPCLLSRYLYGGITNQKSKAKICLPVALSLRRMCMFSSLPVLVVLRALCGLFFGFVFMTTFWIVFYTYTHVFVSFLLSPKLNRHLCYGVYRCNHTHADILILCIILCFHFVICTSNIVRSLCLH